MDAFLERRWFPLTLVTAVFSVLATPNEPPALAVPGYVLALAAFPFTLRARSLHAGPPRNPWRAAVGRWTTGGPSRWLFVVAFAGIAGCVSWSRYELPWHAPLSAVVAGGAVYGATHPLPWVAAAVTPR